MPATNSKDTATTPTHSVILRFSNTLKLFAKNICAMKNATAPLITAPSNARIIICVRDALLFTPATNAAAKIAILASIAFNSRVTMNQVFTEGIRRISPVDLAMAHEMGYAVKLLAPMRALTFVCIPR